MTLYGAYEDLPAPQRQEAAKEAAPVAPCPTHGYNKDGHLELKQVSLHWRQWGQWAPRRLGRRAGHTSDSTETSVTIEAWPQSRLLLAPPPPARCLLAACQAAEPLRTGAAGEWRPGRGASRHPRASVPAGRAALGMRQTPARAGGWPGSMVRVGARGR